MTKNEIKKILMSLRTAENDSKVNNLLGKIDLIAEEKLSSMVSKIGDNEESIKNYLLERLNKKEEKSVNEHTPINEMFTYGISGNTIHLHMPVDLHDMIAKKGILKTVDTVNLQLLDAIDKINKMKNEGYFKFLGKENIYMISPILVGRELKFLNELDFKTNSYKKSELQDEKFVASHPEAMLATYIFGKETNVGTATINLDKVNSKEWQKKKEDKVKEFNKKGIELEEENQK